MSKLLDPCGPDFCGGQPCCASNAQCRGVEHKAECSCPPGYDGDARFECRPSSNRGGGGGFTRGGGGSSSGIQYLRILDTLVLILYIFTYV